VSTSDLMSMPVNAPLPSAPDHSNIKNAAHPFFNKVRARARVHCRVGGG
jgi:hypothetical protein